MAVFRRLSRVYLFQNDIAFIIEQGAKTTVNAYISNNLDEQWTHDPLTLRQIKSDEFI